MAKQCWVLHSNGVVHGVCATERSVKAKAEAMIRKQANLLPDTH